MSEEENTIKEKLDELRECLEYGLDYKDYISVVNVFDYIEKILEKQRKEIEIKDKVIEEMAEYIGNLDTDEDICKEINVPVNEFGECEIACKDCVKEYFRNKVKGEKE